MTILKAGLLSAAVVAGGFSASAVRADVFTNVPEASGATLVYQLAIPGVRPDYNHNAIPYSVNNSGSIANGSFSRVGYYLELSGSTNTNDHNGFVYVSFDAGTPGFTNNASKLGVPNAASGEVYQTNISNMNVVSNVPGIVTGTSMTGGNIEFWPNDYDPANAAGVPNASDSTYDAGDNISAAVGYGSMQIHNHNTGTTVPQTLFGFNNWGSNGFLPNVDLGIGNNTGSGNGQVNPDWTFRSNGVDYTASTLQIVAFVPEPASLSLLAVGGMALLARRRR